MKTTKTALAGILLALTVAACRTAAPVKPIPLGALISGAQQAALLTYNYDLTSTSYIYCKLVDKSGDAWGNGGAFVSQVPIKTTGSSTTVEAVTASTNPFATVAVGDVILARTAAGVEYTRLVTARASADSITVDTTVDLGASASFRWFKAACGSTMADGWVDARQFYNLTFVRTITTINAASIDSQVECKHDMNATAAVIIDTKNATGTGTYATTLFAGAWDACRLGMKVNTDGGAQSITVTAEKNQ